MKVITRKIAIGKKQIIQLKDQNENIIPDTLSVKHYIQSQVIPKVTEQPQQKDAERRFRRYNKYIKTGNILRSQKHEK